MFKSIPIRLNIITNIVFITAVGITLVLTVQYYYINKLTLSATNTLFSNITTNVEDKMISYDRNLVNIIGYLEEIAGVEEKPEIGVNHPATNVMIKTISTLRDIYSVYVGHADGSFFQVANLTLNKAVHEKFNAPANAAWAIVKDIRTSRIRHIQFIDAELNTVASRNELSTYTPYDRPWFKQAALESSVVRTAPYTFFMLRSAGITYAKRLSELSTAVIGVDIYLDSISQFLDKTKVFEQNNVVILDENETVLVASGGYNVGLIDMVVNSDIQPGGVSRIKYLGKTYLVKVKDVADGYLNSKKLIVAIPLSVMSKPYDVITKVSFYMTVALAIILLPLIFFSSRILEKPLQELMKENELIRQRRFREVTPVKTIIKEYQDLSSSLVRMSADIESYQLSQQLLFDSFVRLLAQAIDDKSSYTGGHCSRVPILCEMLSMAASESSDDIFADFTISNMDEWREVQIAGWLHDCGKLTTPEYVVDKATRLETIYNRIHEVRTRFEVIWRDYEILAYKRLSEGADPEMVSRWLSEQQEQLVDDFNFIAEKNDGDNFISEEDIERIKKIAQREWVRHFDSTLGLSYDESQRIDKDKVRTPAVENLLADKPEHIVERAGFDEEAFRNSGFNMDVPEYLYNFGEIHNLSVAKGTLTDEERFKINEHIIMTIKMMEQMPFPEHLANVPEYACAHHETMIGSGYPKGLKREEMSVPARIMAVADIYEALTAADRPYKKAKTLSESIRILSFMAKDGHIDQDIFKLFIKSGVYKEYAEQFLQPEQIDEIDESEYL